MSLQDVLSQFKTQATAQGLSEEAYLLQSLMIALHSGDDTQIQAFKTAATEPADQTFFEDLATDTGALNNLINGESDPLSIHKDGSVPLAANWNVGNKEITGIAKLGVGTDTTIQENNINLQEFQITSSGVVALFKRDGNDAFSFGDILGGYAAFHRNLISHGATNIGEAGGTVLPFGNLYLGTDGANYTQFSNGSINVNGANPLVFNINSSEVGRFDPTSGNLKLVNNLAVGANQVVGPRVAGGTTVGGTATGTDAAIINNLLTEFNALIGALKPGGHGLIA